MAEIVFDHVSKHYPDGLHAVRALDLAIEDGEFLVLVGPSGCGKSTALRMVAGLEDITDGRHPDRRRGGQRPVAARPQHRHGVPELRALPAPDRRREHRLRPAGAGGAEGARSPRKVEARRRIARARRLSRRASPRSFPAASASAWPWAAPSSASRRPSSWTSRCPTSMRGCACRCAPRSPRIQQMTGVTTIYVTHDQIEAMTMGDRVAVMNRGVLQQLGDAARRSTTSRPTSSSRASSARRRST